MASRPKRKRKSTDSQPAVMPAVATTDTVQRTTPSSTQDIKVWLGSVWQLSSIQLSKPVEKSLPVKQNYIRQPHGLDL